MRDYLEYSITFLIISGAIDKAQGQCVDNPPGDPGTNCQLVLRASQCGNQHYAQWCCKTCKIANEMKTTKGIGL